MKKVLWISRHEMTKDQFDDLTRIAGEPVELTLWQDTVTDIHQLLPTIKEVDVVAAVLPLQLIAELLPFLEGKPLLQAESDRVPTGRILHLQDGRTEQEYAFRHRCWQQVLKLELQTVRL